MKSGIGGNTMGPAPANHDSASARATTPGSPADIVARIERLPVTRFHIKARFIVGVATIFDGYDALMIAAVMPVLVGLWAIPPGKVGFLISAANVGQLIGALFFGWLADRIGRLKTLTLSVALYSLAAFACAFAWDYNSMAILRFIEGLGLGGEVPVAAAYIGEMAKAKGRGRFFLLYESIFTLGLLGATVLGIFLVPAFGWQSMFFVGALPALLTIVLRWQLPESARWLADRGRAAEADRIVGDIEQMARAAGQPLPEPSRSLAATANVTASWSELFSDYYRRRTFCVWALWFCDYFVSWGISGWAPTIYATVFKLDYGTSMRYALATSVASVVGGFTVAFLVDRTGRVKWFAGAFALAAAALLTLWWVGPYSATFVMCMLALAYFFIGSNSSMLFLYTAEIYPTRLRARGTSTGTAFNRLSSSVGPPIVGATLAGFGLGSVYLLLGCVALVGAIVAAAFAVETRERVMEDVSP